MITLKKDPDTHEDIIDILHPLLKKWFFSKFEGFSLPQLFSVLEIQKRNNILVSAPTGATKTLTGFLSVLNELIDSEEKGILEDRVYCVYVSPLKALNYDIEVNLLEPLKEIEAIAGRPLGIRVGVRTGDTTPYQRSKMSKNPPHILITTPESLAIMLTTLAFRKHLSAVSWCIVDEIHALAESKRGVHLSLTLEQLTLLSGHMSRIGLSATISPIEEVAKYLSGSKRDCIIVDIQYLKSLDMKVVSPLPSLIDQDHHTVHQALYEKMHSLIQQHKTTLIFTNTRAATERVVHILKEKYPGSYKANIGAHHGSLSKETRHSIEKDLRQGNLKVVVSSTSLELGIDIGHIGLVILLGSPKSVARALQRVGRAGHKLHQTAKGIILVYDRDDLVECSVLLRSAIEKKIDRIHIPKNCLDVLAQQIVGIIISQKMPRKDLFELITRSYCYSDLDYSDFKDVIDYLCGNHSSLEDRYIYAKIWYDEKTGMIGRKGKMTRIIYLSNVGTIPQETEVLVKVGDQVVGTLDEMFLERLKRGDVFVLGGQTYEFRHAKGMVAYVNASVDRPPTVPSWISEMLPLSFDLATEIGIFRRLVSSRFGYGEPKEAIISFIKSYLYVDDIASSAIYEYLKEQYDFLAVPTDKQIIIERYYDGSQNYYFFHSMFGRRVNDCLSRALALAVSKAQRKDVEIGINDNGFYLSSKKAINIKKALLLIRSDKLDLVLAAAIDKTEILKRRFRHCASRSLMILRNYKGKKKTVGKQQVSSQILINSVRRISQDFPILKEARREVLQDLMDIKNTKDVFVCIETKAIKVTEKESAFPSPFSFNLFIQGFSDIFKAEDKVEFLNRMHQKVTAQLEMKRKGIPYGFSLKEQASEENLRFRSELTKLYKKRQLDYQQRMLLKELNRLDTDSSMKAEVEKLIRREDVNPKLFAKVKEHQKHIISSWPKDLGRFVIRKAEENFSYHDFWEEIDDRIKIKEEEYKDNLKKEFLSAARKVGLSANIQHDMIGLIDGSQRCSEETRRWIDELLSGTVPKIWSDDIIRFIKKTVKLI